MKQFVKVLVTIGICTSLAGCGNTPTYGTGKSQGRLLYDSVTSVTQLSTSLNTGGIDYSQRDEPIPSPDKDTLPKPKEVKKIKKTEVQKARKKANKEDNKKTSENIGTIKILDEDGNEQEVVKINPNNRKQVAEIQAPKRRSLVEPPSPYRTPEATAPIGDVGKPEIDLEKAREERAKAKEREESGGLFGLFKKKKDEEEDEENEDEENDDDDTSADDEETANNTTSTDNNRDR